MTDKYRYERKFVLCSKRIHELFLVLKLHPASFREVYEPRDINNIYLDAPDHSSFEENVAGVARRTKCRVRWYGVQRGTITQPTLEFKNKTGLVGSKQQFPLARLEVDRPFLENLRDCFGRSELPEIVSENLRRLEPTQVNRYRRHYFAARAGAVRITVDRDLVFYGVSRTDVPRPQWEHEDTIVELKYDREHETIVDEVSSHLQLRVAKSSKYVLGLTAIHEH